MLHHVCDVAYDENMCGPIRTRKCRSTNWLINYMQGSTKYIQYIHVPKEPYNQHENLQHWIEKQKHLLWSY